MASLLSLQLVNLTQLITSSIPTWDAGCKFQLTTKCDYADCSGTTKFRVQNMAMPAGIGTHIDAPAHCIPGAATVDQLLLNSPCASCIVIDVRDRATATYQLSVDDIKQFEAKHGAIASGSLMIVNTGWSRFWRQPEQYRNNYQFPSVSPQAAHYLADRGIVGIAIDTLSPDALPGDFATHQILLSRGCYIIENIADCSQLPPIGAQVIIAPLYVQGATEAPVRMFAWW